MENTQAYARGILESFFNDTRLNETRGAYGNKLGLQFIAEMGELVAEMEELVAEMEECKSELHKSKDWMSAETAKLQEKIEESRKDSHS
jgi:predicted metalloendopeptidase